MNTLDFYDVNYDELLLDKKEIYLLMGYDDYAVDSRVTELVDQVLNEVTGLVTPRCGYVLRQGEVEGKECLRIGDVRFNPGRIITFAMKDASFYAFLLLPLEINMMSIVKY